MFSHSINTASFFPILFAALILLLSLAGVAAVQYNTSLGMGALHSNSGGDFDTALGANALFSNTTGRVNTANGVDAFSLRFHSQLTRLGCLLGRGLSLVR